MDGSKYFMASDAMSWSLCHRRAWYDLHPPEDHVVEPDPFVELVMAKGIEHEKAVLESLGPYVEAMGTEHTAALMAQKAPLIYQGTLVNDELGVICKPDFLVLVDDAYRAEDAKLANSAEEKKEIMAQLGTYERVLGSGHAARALLSNGEIYELRDRDRRTADAFLQDMRSVADTDKRPAANYTASKCEACPYRSICVPEFKQQENLGLNYFVQNRAIPELVNRGITTLSDLGKASTNDLKDVPYLKRPERQNRAILQARSLLNRQIYRLGPTRQAPGTSIHFDVETWPFGANGKGTVYLWGFLLPPYRVDQDYEYIWSDEHDGAGDRGGWMAFLEYVAGLRARIPDACLAHYTDFERIQVKTYATRYGMEDHPIVRWILDDDRSCFDIKEAIADSLILPVTGYGLKTICKEPDLVNFQWQLEGSGSQWSVVRYGQYLECDEGTEREAIRQELLAYNRDDVAATRAQEVWMQTLAR